MYHNIILSCMYIFKWQLLCSAAAPVQLQYTSSISCSYPSYSLPLLSPESWSCPGSCLLLLCRRVYTELLFPARTIPVPVYSSCLSFWLLLVCLILSLLLYTAQVSSYCPVSLLLYTVPASDCLPIQSRLLNTAPVSWSYPSSSIQLRDLGPASWSSPSSCFTFLSLLLYTAPSRLMAVYSVYMQLISHASITARLLYTATAFSFCLLFLYTAPVSCYCIVRFTIWKCLQIQ